MVLRATDFSSFTELYAYHLHTLLGASRMEPINYVNRYINIAMLAFTHTTEMYLYLQSKTVISAFLVGINSVSTPN